MRVTLPPRFVGFDKDIRHALRSIIVPTEASLQDKTKQDKTRQHKATQGNTRQHKTTQDNTRQNPNPNPDP
jgi:hypothetical protein